MSEKQIKVSYSWYKTKVPSYEWNEYYSKNNSYTFLKKYKEGKNEFVEMGFLAVVPPFDSIEITDLEELRQIDLHRKEVNIYSRPFEEKEL